MLLLKFDQYQYTNTDIHGSLFVLPMLIPLHILEDYSIQIPILYNNTNTNTDLCILIHTDTICFQFLPIIYRYCLKYQLISSISTIRTSYVSVPAFLTNSNTGYWCWYISFYQVLVEYQLALRSALELYINTNGYQSLSLRSTEKSEIIDLQVREIKIWNICDI